MEANKLLSQAWSPLLTTSSSPSKIVQQKLRYSPVVSVLTRPPANRETYSDKSSITLKPLEVIQEKKNVYNDNFIDQLLIDRLSNSVQVATGLRNNKSGFEGLVEAAKDASRNFNPMRQQEIVLQALELAIPWPISFMIKTLMPPSTFAREYFAAFTTVFFAWLVGPCEVKESELNGRREKNVVHIKKCRFLEETNCVGMCINLCKMPSQKFIKESMGVAINMVPNYNDMSCEMIFGEDPPEAADDPVFKQPCYKLCNAKQKHSRECTS